MSYTLGEAAKATGKDRATISRAIKKGKISAKKNDHGQWSIDPSELHRVYPARQQDNSARTVAGATERNTELVIENRELQAKLTATTQQVRNLQNDKEFLQKELSKATSLLTDQREKGEEKEPTSNSVKIWAGLLIVVVIGLLVLAASF